MFYGVILTSYNCNCHRYAIAIVKFSKYVVSILQLNFLHQITIYSQSNQIMLTEINHTRIGKINNITNEIINDIRNEINLLVYL
jgi:hypothetical protein